MEDAIYSLFGVRELASMHRHLLKQKSMGQFIGPEVGNGIVQTTLIELWQDSIFEFLSSVRNHRRVGRHEQAS